MPTIKAVCGRCHRAHDASTSCTKQYHRGTTKERGYADEWPKFRKAFLDSVKWLCHDCGQMASDVHHIIKVRDAPELRLVPSNCMALCGECHRVRTGRGE